MSAQGPTIAGTGADAGGRLELWNNPGNITANDGQLATCVMAGAGDGSNQLQASNFRFSVPNGAANLEIQVDIKRQSTGGNLSDAGVFLLDNGGASTGSDLSAAGNWPTSLTLNTYGPSKWGLNDAQLLAIVNTPAFGVGFFVQQVTSNPTATVDYIQITISYTIGGIAEAAYGSGTLGVVGV